MNSTWADSIEHLRNIILGVGVEPAVIGGLPSLTIDCVALRPVDGYPSVRYFGQSATDEPLLEVIVRNKSYKTGQSWYSAIKKALDQYRAEDYGIDSCLLTGSPGFLGADENGFNEWHMLFHVTTFERSDLNG